MKIYFENGPLVGYNKFLLDELFIDEVKPDYWCDASAGYSNNVLALDHFSNCHYDCVVYTNSLAALSSKYTWNEEINDFDIFMREVQSDEFKRISELHGGKIRPSQNVLMMFMSGCFGCLRHEI